MQPQQFSFAISIALACGAFSTSIHAQHSEDLHQLKQDLQTGKTTATKLLEQVQNRHALINPQIAAVSAVRAEAKQDAEQADRIKNPRLILQGLPIMVKDNIAIQGMPTTAGSLALANNIASSDAFLVAKLRAAGAVLAGKTNLSEWANFRSSKATSGWSSVGGQTRNPYNLNKTPCGSSSGSGAAVAARLIPAAIGTETDGSIVCPAAVNGLVGLKPTLGLVSRSGVIPLSHSQDTAGPMTLSVRDAALLMNVIAGSDASDPATLAADQHQTDYTQGLDAQALQGKRIGIVSALLKGYDKQTLALFKRSVDILKAQGAIIVDQVEIPNMEKAGKDEYTVLVYDFKADLNAYLANTPSTVNTRSMDDVIAFNKKNAKQVMPHFGQEIMLYTQAKAGALSDKAYLDASANAKRLSGPEGIDAALKKHQLDALIAPTTGPAWDINYKKGDAIIGSASSPAAIAGYPHLTVPMGLVKGLPVGISFFASAWSDASLLKIGYAFEQARPALPAPKLMK
ncbi:amidase [Undibacterium fentianense]|uniref:Amidase n=1 Tax=Undibacterium fentianense TaxID=2828728 RepID=A0A941E4G6_9BURK|nr:amidase [Undibacterium fentianense]MBR7800429.1 amidase [Undibacterium fentianense]